MERIIDGKKIWIIGYDKDTMYYSDGIRQHHSRFYYRHPRNYSDRFGLWFIARFADGSRKRVYFSEVVYR